MSKGRLSKVFPGGNTAYGFYSFYDYIIEPDATRIFVIKGGPGVGKSTFMRKIGEDMLVRGYDVEYHCCSSDNGSLDGIVIPAIRVAFLDGTSPHIVDPKHPGAVDEIIHLGDHWNVEGLQNNKKEILATNKEIGRLFRRAYVHLAGAKLFLDEVETYYTESNAFNVGAFDRMVLDLTHDIFEGKINYTDSPKSRHLFATAITPDGPVSHLETVVGHLSKRYIINGDDGTGKTTLVRRLMEASLARGYNVTAFHCALNPKVIDHLVIHDLSIAIINNVEPHIYNPKKDDVIIDTMTCVDPVINEAYLAEKGTARGMYRQCMEQAISFIGRAKKMHDEMEKYYIPHMDFNAINLRREVILSRILELANQ
ncbi:PRK06851 family protein [Pelotomaculum propionicicum]|uniref:PRK06851 family protein n=1 Tax=Pelotomaculum propionicicum TaxID=258475 RepID=UPI003B790230